MKQRFCVRHLCVITTFCLAALFLSGPFSRADVVYRYDTGAATERYNNSEGVETEDNWVATAFVVVAGGTRLVSIDYPMGETYFAQPVSAVIYSGADISDPSAGGGLVRLQTTDTTLTGAAGDVATLTLDTPVDFNEGDVFYAAILIPGVTGDKFPFFNDTSAPSGHSFFDVGPAQGAAYDLDNTANATVLGATHPVVGAGVQSAGDTWLRVNATVP
jgi:hypothetical protein